MGKGERKPSFQANVVTVQLAIRVVRVCLCDVGVLLLNAIKTELVLGVMTATDVIFFLLDGDPDPPTEQEISHKVKADIHQINN